jgi:hypothetical protein
MKQHEQIISFLATLLALLIVYIGTLVFASQYPAIIGKVETFGLGTITGGLIGILRIPSNKSVTVDNPPSQPVPTEDAAQ